MTYIIKTTSWEVCEESWCTTFILKSFTFDGKVCRLEPYTNRAGSIEGFETRLHKFMHMLIDAVLWYRRSSDEEEKASALRVIADLEASFEEEYLSRWVEAHQYQEILEGL